MPIMIFGVLVLTTVLCYMCLTLWWYDEDEDYFKRVVSKVFRKCGCSKWYTYESSSEADTHSSQLTNSHSNDNIITWVDKRNNWTHMIEYNDLNILLNDCSLVLQEEQMVQRCGLELGELQHEENTTHTDNKPSTELLLNEDLVVNQSQSNGTGDIEEGVLKDLGSTDQVPVPGNAELKNKDDGHEDNYLPAPSCGDGIEEGGLQDLESFVEKKYSNQYMSKTNIAVSKPVENDSKKKDGYSMHQDRKSPARLLSFENMKSGQDSPTAAGGIEEDALGGSESCGAAKDHGQALHKPLRQYTHIVVPKYPADCVHANPRDTREVPISCAICLADYSISDEVTLAANAECTHVFHRECISRWLIRDLEKKKSNSIGLQVLPKSMSLECPMCRQDFVKLVTEFDREADRVWVTLDLDDQAESS